MEFFYDNRLSQWHFVAHWQCPFNSLISPSMHWLRDHRRRKILETPFPDTWRGIIRSHVAFYQRLPLADQKRLEDLVQVFLAEKTWEGCGGLELTDDIRLTIAAQACILILKLPDDLFRNVESILVYPSTVLSPPRPLGFFENATAPLQPAIPILGEAHLGGPVILVWDDIEKTARHPEKGHNVVYHEFSHKLDMLTGAANGTPPLPNQLDYKRWQSVLGREFEQLKARVQTGKQTWLDAYATTNAAEFFAVATEYFFDRPKEMKESHRDLYDVLSGFYRQDPAEY